MALLFETADLKYTVYSYHQAFKGEKTGKLLKK